MRRILWSVLFFSLASVVLPLPASARYLTAEEVRFIAFSKGIVRIEEIELDDGVWEVEGDDATGHEIEIRIDAASGAIIKIRRD